jgi:hypothetical protein
MLSSGNFEDRSTTQRQKLEESSATHFAWKKKMHRGGGSLVQLPN